MLIEVISISLLLKNNKYQSNKIVNLTTEYTGFLFEYKNSISEYIGLKKLMNFLLLKMLNYIQLLRRPNITQK